MKRSRHMSIRTRRAISGYLFILPFIIGFVAFMLYPLFDSFRMSLSTVHISTAGFDLEFVGLQNYIKAFTIDPEFNELLWNKIVRMLTHSLAILVVSFVIAIVLNQKFKGRTFVRAVFFLPVILSSGVLVGLETDNSLMAGMKDMIAASSSINMIEGMMEILRLTGIGGDLLDVVFTLIEEVYDIVMASGIQIIVFLSGLQNVPASLYEAADVEGCSKWEAFWTITFPIVSPLLLVNIVYTIVDFFMKIDAAAGETDLMEKIEETMVINLDYGFASAMSWIYFLVAIIMIALSSLIISRGVVKSYE